MSKDYSEVIFSFDEIDNMIDDIVGGMRKVNSKEIGLDERCGYVYFNDEYICIKKNNKKVIEVKRFEKFRLEHSESLKILCRSRSVLFG